MSLNPVMNPNELEHFKRDINLFMEQGYGGYKSIDDIDPRNRESFEKYVEDAKVIQALAQKALETARRRTNKQYEAVFEDDDVEEAGDVVYGPGGKVIGKGKHMLRGKGPKIGAASDDAEQKELQRIDDVNKEFALRWRILYEKSHVSRRNNYDDYFSRLENMDINPVLSPGELKDFEDDVDHIFRVGYGSFIDINDIYPQARDRFERYVDDAKSIQALAQKALQAARRRTNKKYEAAFEDDDMEKAGDVVYGPGGKVVGKGKHMARGEEYHKGCNRVYGKY